jgi:hypothetical protein
MSKPAHPLTATLIIVIDIMLVRRKHWLFTLLGLKQVIDLLSRTVNERLELKKKGPFGHLWSSASRTHVSTSADPKL